MKWKRMVVFVSFVFMLFLLSGCALDGEGIEKFINEITGVETEDSSLPEQFGASGEDSHGNDDGQIFKDEDITGEIKEETQEEEGDVPLEVESVSEDRYVYQQLNEEEQLVYDQLYDASLNFREDTIVSTIDCDVIERAYAALQSDYSDIFWIKGFRYTEYTRNGKTIKISVHPTYSMTYEEKEEAEKKIQQEAEAYLSLIPEGADDYTVEKIFYEALASNVEYDLEAENNQNIYSAFVTKRTVCQGFTRAMQYLLEKEGIQSVNISGHADGETHAWNLVCLEGNYYYTDVTWGKTSCVREKEDLMKVNYAWLNMTTEEISKTHRAEVDFELPECTDRSMGYFVREGRYLDTMDTDRFEEMIRISRENMEEYFVCKFETEELLERYKQYYIEEQHIFDCYDVETMNHSEDSMNNLLYFFPKVQ